MEKKQNKMSKETQEFLKNLQNDRMMIKTSKPRKDKNISSGSEKFYEFLFKLLCFIEYPFKIIGGICSLLYAYNIYRICSEDGWQGLFNINTLYIIIYFVILAIIKKAEEVLYKKI